MNPPKISIVWIILLKVLYPFYKVLHVPYRKNPTTFLFASLTLICLPLAGIGSYLAISSFLQPPNTDGTRLIIGALMGGIGIKLLIKGSRAIQRRHISKTGELKHPGQPWLWHKKWTVDRIKSLRILPSSPLSTGWAFTATFIFFSGLFIWFAIRDYHYDRRFPIWYMLFPVVGVCCLCWTTFRTLKWRKFGRAFFKMDSKPGIIGGKISGTIEMSVKLPPETTFVLRLVCVNRRRVPRTPRSAQTTEERTIWKVTNPIAFQVSDFGSSRSLIPVSFHIPADCSPTSDSNPRDEIIWRIEMEANKPGLGENYVTVFEVPVFRLQKRAHLK